MSYHRPWAHLSDTPFRKYKVWTHEGGIATPFIAHWPGEIESDTMSDEVTHVMDLMPTVLDAAGATYPSTFEGRDLTALEGESLMPVLRMADRSGHEEVNWLHTDNHAIRQRRWKLVSLDGRESWQLYDLIADRTETENRASDHPEVVQKLADRHQAWMDRIGALSWEDYRRRRKTLHSN
jgi:arylsulfatase